MSGAGGGMGSHAVVVGGWLLSHGSIDNTRKLVILCRRQTKLIIQHLNVKSVGFLLNYSKHSETINFADALHLNSCVSLLSRPGAF